MYSSTKIGFLGAGNMGGAILDGLLTKNFALPALIGASGRDGEKLKRFCSNRGITPYTNEELVQNCPILVIGLKPAIFGEVLPPLVPVMKQHTKLVISIAAGLSLEKLQGLVGAGIPVVRTMPNINARIGMSMTGVCFGQDCSRGLQEYTLSLLNCVGKAIVLPENNFSIFSALAGASPAYVFMFIEALAKAGVKDGMTKAEATVAAAQAVLGSAQFLLNQLEEGKHPMSLVDAVCSPAGTTIAGVSVLEQQGFTGIVMDAALATAQRDRDLLKKS